MQIEPGWLCNKESPSVCDRHGNGKLTPEIGEACDDGNLRDGDGCHRNMTIQEGWLCDGRSPTTCDQHGNGKLVKEIGEECDDGNLRN